MEETTRMNNQSIGREKSAIIPDQIIEFRDDDYRNHMRDSGPKPGQVWLLNDGKRAEYAVVLGIDDDPRIVIVTAMSNNAALQTKDSMVIGHSPMGMPMVIWPRLTVKAPVRLLDAPCGELRDDILHCAIHHDENKSLGVTVGRDPEEIWQPALRRLRERILLFVAWHNMCDALPELHAEHQLQYETSTDRMAYADALRDVLHLPPSQRLAVADGRLELTDEQQRRLANAGITKAPEQQAVISDEYLIMAEQPRWRDVADILAQTGEGDPRLRLAHKAQFELAARISGHRDDAVEDAFEQAAAIIRGDERV